MHARTSNVIQFPGGYGRTRGGFEQIRLQIDALDRELLTLTQGNSWTSGEWARQTATPIVRTEYIRSHLTAASAISPTVSQYRRRRLARVRDELLCMLSATRISLTRMGDPALGPTGRQEVLEKLSAHRKRQQRIFRKLDNCWPT
jgi:hypothetical protein